MSFRDSVDYVSQDRISQLARTYWLTTQQLLKNNNSSTCSAETYRPFLPDVMERIYRQELLASGFSHRRCLALELNQYLEQWLWPHFHPNTSSRAHVLSICAMVNEKARGRVPIWPTFVATSDKFSGLVQQVLHILLDESPQILAVNPLLTDITNTKSSSDNEENGKQQQVSENASDPVQQKKCILEHIVLIIFLSHCFTNLAEVGVLRRSLRELYSLLIWQDHLQPTRLSLELKSHPRYARLLKKLQKHRDTKVSTTERENMIFQHSFIPRILDVFLTLLNSIPEKDEDKPIEPLLIHYLERFILLLVDLESMLLTRRILNVILDDRHIVVYCQKSALIKRPDGKLFSELVDLLAFYAHFHIDESTGEPLDEAEMDKRHCAKLSNLQLKTFTLHKDKLLSFSVSHPAGIETAQLLRKHLSVLNRDELYHLASCFGLVTLKKESSANATQNDEQNDDDNDNNQLPAKRLRLNNSDDTNEFNLNCLRDKLEAKLMDKDLIIRIIIHHFARRQSELELINSLSLYPTEDLIWDENRVPTEYYSGENCLALPKLGLQFLTLQDYLLRNFNLFRLESTYEIRQDIEDAIIRLKAWRGEFGQAVFDGWSRMALPIQAFNIVEVAKPDLGAKHPARVRADVRVALAGLRPEIRKEWLGLRRHDPVFLVTIRPTKQQGWKFNMNEPFPSQVGLHYVRGCEIEGQVDKEGKLVPDEERLGFLPLKGEKPNLVDTLPTWRVRLDPVQYQTDVDHLKAEQMRAEVLRSKVIRAKREGRTAEEIQVLQAQVDEAEQVSPEDLYDTFNVLIRRKPKENNFKAVLETIRDLMNIRSVVPEWLLDLLMGYLDPAAAHYTHLPDVYEPRQNWLDTFLSPEHLKRSLSQYNVEFIDKRQSRKWKSSSQTEITDNITTSTDPPGPPYRLIFPKLNDDPTANVQAMIPSDMITQKNSASNKLDDACVNQSKSGDIKPTLIAEAYDPPLQPPWSLLAQAGGHFPGILSTNSKLGNQVPFTSAQIEAIRSGMQCGLTLVVGPPGTGKTDVAVQIIHNLYHNYPNQRILIVTHSNQALNQLFEKIIALDVDERHLLRLGHGEEGLDTDKDFSRYGRVDYILAKRIHLLQEVTRLAKTLNPSSAIPQLSTDLPDTDLSDSTNNNLIHLQTCETAQYFYVQEVLSRWEDFISKVAANNTAHLMHTDQSTADTTMYDPSLIRQSFPFTEYFTGQKSPPDEIMNQLFPGRNLLEDVALAQTYFRHLHSIFTQLDEFRAFELMRTGTERANYLLIQEAKIIAMTCTHAALRRRDLVQLGFTYDTILMEEAAQILEIETFIPLLLQNPDISGRNRLKRWIMIGDHHQLPPVVKNQAFNNYSNMGQSLFARLVKLGVPTVQLDAQGRARPSLSRLYSWRYDRLTDLPHTLNEQQYLLANPGFRYDVQLINVEDYKGIGESEPSPYFYQNLAEAEYVVAVYMYMRILGYPAEKITILTTYNGQKHLIRDVIAARCAQNPLLGSPSKVTTVDRFQGQQNDYVLVSLVRTRTVGHLRDVRRLVVALSRARLGLYVFARIEQFANCPELKPAFDLLLNRKFGEEMKPTELHLTPWEVWINPCSPTALEIQHRMQADAELNQTPLIIKDMPHMSSYVRELYDQKLQYLLTQLQQQQTKPKVTTVTTTSVDINITSTSILSTDANEILQQEQSKLITEDNDITQTSQEMNNTDLMSIDHLDDVVTTTTDEINADNSVEMVDTNN
ncbi:RNA helicase aquarius [Schistosoma japonicum]|nr:RNA helicase aquarius [Schistosoma japonicum]